METDWDFEEYAHEDLKDGQDDELVLDCGFKGCLMPGEHFRHECHDAEMLIQQELSAERGGKRCPDGDWVSDQPGGLHCECCGCIFISSEGRPNCKVCDGRLTALSEGSVGE